MDLLKELEKVDDQTLEQVRAALSMNSVARKRPRGRPRVLPQECSRYELLVPTALLEEFRALGGNAEVMRRLIQRFVDDSRP